MLTAEAVPSGELLTLVPANTRLPPGHPRNAERAHNLAKFLYRLRMRGAIEIDGCTYCLAGATIRVVDKDVLTRISWRHLTEAQQVARPETAQPLRVVKGGRS